MQGIVECLFLIFGRVFDLTSLILRYSQSSHTSNVIEGNINAFYSSPCKIFEQEISTHLCHKTQTVCQYHDLTIPPKMELRTVCSKSQSCFGYCPLEVISYYMQPMYVETGNILFLNFLVSL